jgi:WD40 repeat protein
MFPFVLACLCAAAEPKGEERSAKTDLYGDPLPPGALLRLGSIRMRHRSVADALSYSADGKTLRSLGRDLVIRHWDAVSGREVRRVVLEKASEVLRPGVHVEWAWGGETVAALADPVLQLWDATTGRERRTILMKKDEVSSLVLSPDGAALAAVAADRTAFVIRVWDVAGGAQRTQMRHSASVLAMKFTPDGKRLGSVGLDAEFHLWDVATGKEVRKFHGPFLQLAFSPDGGRIASTDRQSVVRVWRVDDGRELATFKDTAGRQIVSVVFSPDGGTLAVGMVGDTILFDVAGRKPPRRLAARGWLRFAPDGKTLASALVGAIHQWDVATGREIAPRPGHDAHISRLAVSPDGRRLASLSPIDPSVRLWDLASGEQQVVLQGDPDVRSHLGAFSADGKEVVTGAMEGRLRLWDATTGRELRHFPLELRNSEGRENPEPLALSLPPDGRQLAAVSMAWHTRQGGHPVYQLDVWDRDSGASALRRQLPMDSWAVSFAPDARILAYRTHDGLVVQDVVTGAEYVRMPGELRWPFAFSPDGRALAAAVYKSKKVATEEPGPEDAEAVVLMELATGKRLLRIGTGPGGFDHLAFAPDGRTLATTHPDAFRLWDTATGKELFRKALPEKHPAPGYSFATSLAFLPSGDRLATGLMDGTILVWDLEPKTWHAGMAAKDLDDLDLERLWADLAGEDAGKAHQAVGTLAAVPQRAVPFLKDRLRSASAPDAGKVRRLIADLESEQFNVRERAGKELAALGEQSDPELRKALEGKPSLEARKRLEELLADAELAGRGVVRSAEVLRTLRAVRALEAMGTAEARQVLDVLAGGDPAARTTRQAREALRRCSPSLKR